MGFNKRIVTKDYILSYTKKNRSLKDVFCADSIICNDKFSMECFSLYIKGFSDQEIFEKLEKLI